MILYNISKRAKVEGTEVTASLCLRLYPWESCAGPLLCLLLLLLTSATDGHTLQLYTIIWWRHQVHYDSLLHWKSANISTRSSWAPPGITEPHHSYPSSHSPSLTSSPPSPHHLSPSSFTPHTPLLHPLSLSTSLPAAQNLKFCQWHEIRI